MIRSVLAAEPHSYAYLLYGNSREKGIIFYDRLQKLAAESNGRFVVRYMLSNQGWLSSFQPWRRGRVDEAAIHAFVQENRPLAHDAQYYMCGPGGMNRTVRQALINLDVPTSRIHYESFGGKVELDQSVRGVSAVAQVALNGQKNTISVPENETILNALLTAGHQPPYSCQSGVCGACRATVKSGEVHMRARMALDDKEIAQGEILTCQAVAKTARLSLQFD